MSDATSNGSLVVDANVWVSALITADSNHAESRRWLDRRLRAYRRISGPSLLLAEISGAIARRRNDPMAAHDAIGELLHLRPLQLVPLDNVLARSAARFAADLRLRGADAVYVALADRLNLPVVTWDNELLTRASGVIGVRTPTGA